ncbi:MAG: LysE family transporter [Verrucomicrobiota bacterium JB023]|nr:LysE family transporter [Verrucomicrobiota bacterium JB023]
MDPLAEWLAFAGVMALGQFSPGPDMLLLTRVSLGEGKRAGFLVVTGIVTGLCLHAALAIGGMAALFSQGGWVETTMKVLASAYLLWLAYGLVQEWFVRWYGAALQEETAKVKGGRSWYLQGLFCNVLNPKAVVFFAGIVAVFLSGERAPWWPVVLWLTIVLEGFLLWGLWVVLLQEKRVRQLYERYSLWLNLGFALGLMGMVLVLWLK